MPPDTLIFSQSCFEGGVNFSGSGMCSLHGTSANNFVIQEFHELLPRYLEMFLKRTHIPFLLYMFVQDGIKCPLTALFPGFHCV